MKSLKIITLITALILATNVQAGFVTGLIVGSALSNNSSSDTPDGSIHTGSDKIVICNDPTDTGCKVLIPRTPNPDGYCPCDVKYMTYEEYVTYKTEDKKFHINDKILVMHNGRISKIIIKYNVII